MKGPAGRNLSQKSSSSRPHVGVGYSCEVDSFLLSDHCPRICTKLRECVALAAKDVVVWVPVRGPTSRPTPCARRNPRLARPCTACPLSSVVRVSHLSSSSSSQNPALCYSGIHSGIRRPWWQWRRYAALLAIDFVQLTSHPRVPVCTSLALYELTLLDGCCSSLV